MDDMMEDDEDMLIFKDDKESDLYQFIKYIVTELVPKELEIPQEEDQENVYETTYGMCKRPFGPLRTRIVEFLAQVFQTFVKEIAEVFAEHGIYDRLLFFFEHYPFHNILHAKVSEIFTHALDKNYEKTIDHLLYKTDLIKMILEISKEKAFYSFQGTGFTLSNGFMAFVRKLANKLIDMQTKNVEVNNCLESIPE